jgi:hypothetical protein
VSLLIYVGDMPLTFSYTGGFSLSGISGEMQAWQVVGLSSITWLVPSLASVQAQVLAFAQLA